MTSHDKKKIKHLIILLFVLAFLFLSAPYETSINGSEAVYKTLRIKDMFYVEVTEDVPVKPSFELFGKTFASKKAIEDIGGKVKITEDNVNIYYSKNKHYQSKNAQYIAKTSGMDFLIYETEQWENFFVKGINIGAAKPGSFPGELKITKEEYLRWFSYIKEMNINTIRVYTTLMPEFYEALFQFNLNREDPLYLMHGVWVNEEDTITLLNAFAEDEKIMKEFIKDGQDIVDIIHGNATLPEKVGFASGEYNFDVSNYVIGWILGTEWDPYFVEGTNKNVIDQYSGEFLYTLKASPFEIFLAKVGDSIISYEHDKYNTYRPTAFSNWLTTDPIKHPNEPMEVEDMAEVDTENILAKPEFDSGLFASYHVYPYYPEFINSDLKYRRYRDGNGKQNTYKAYLQDLINHHSKPVIVAEFGVPSSRGKAHDARPSGYNQGNHTEREQGRIINHMFQDIYDTGYMGGFVFSWQDEWFKKTWNTMDFEDAQGRAYWSNVQTNEQHFGLMAFDPGFEKSICYPDGKREDWSQDLPFLQTKDLDLYVKSDERYVYFAVDGHDFENKELTLFFDTIPNQGIKVFNGRRFNEGIDFLMKIDKKYNSRIYVDSYYDNYRFLYEEDTEIKKDAFSPIRLSLNKRLYFPEEKLFRDPQYYETGLLTYGNGNPGSEDYHSLSDFYEEDGFLEIRVPWQLLNVMNPAKKWVVDDFNKYDEVRPMEVKGIMISIEQEPLKLYSWDKWDLPTYHERLKESYYIVQEFLKSFPDK